MAYYYIRDSLLLVDEDAQYEFKAHRNFSSDEVPAWRADGTKICPTRAIAEYYKLKNANRTRQPISRNICGFLNSGYGGNIFIGVLDSGKVVGIPLSSLQKDHLLLSLEDALRRFKPRVPLEFLKVAFIPVIDDESEAPFLKEPNFSEPPNSIKIHPHQMRTSSLCWCDHHSLNRFKLGYLSMNYVVEIRVAALHPKLRTPEVSLALSKLMKNHMSPLERLSWPAFTSEDGNLFYRILNSLVKYTHDEITQCNNIATEYFVRNELQSLEDETVVDVERRLHLQSLMPEGVTISKTYLHSILKHVDISASEFSPLPIQDSDEETSESTEKENSISALDKDSKESIGVTLDLKPLNNASPANETPINGSQDTQEETNEIKDETNKVDDVPTVSPEKVSSPTMIGSTIFVDDLLKID